MLLNYRQEIEGTDEPISITKKSTSYKTKNRDNYQSSKDFQTRRKDVKAKVSFQRYKAIRPRLKSPEYRAVMERHGIHMAETMFYDVYPERDPEGMLTKFVTTADKIESGACSKWSYLKSQLTKRVAPTSLQLPRIKLPKTKEFPSMAKASVCATGVFWRPRAVSDA